jgi:hypothetical protein
LQMLLLTPAHTSLLQSWIRRKRLFQINLELGWARLVRVLEQLCVRIIWGRFSLQPFLLAIRSNFQFYHRDSHGYLPETSPLQEFKVWTENAIQVQRSFSLTVSISKFGN